MSAVNGDFLLQLTNQTGKAWQKRHVELGAFAPFYPVCRHEEAQLIAVVGGEGSFFVDGKEYPCKSGDVTLLLPYALYTVVACGGAVLQLDVLAFNLRKLCQTPSGSKLLRCIPSFDCAMPVATLCDLEDKANALRLIDGFDQMGDERLDMLARILDKNVVVGGGKTNVNAENKLCYAVERAINYLHGNFTDEISVTKLADICGYDEYYFMKLFKRFCGRTAIEYLNALRLCYATWRIVGSHDEISAVAVESGFANVSYFNRQYKRFYGATPKEIRSFAKSNDEIRKNKGGEKV